MGSRVQVPQSNLSNNDGRNKKVKIFGTKWKHIARKHRFVHVCFKSLAMKDTMNLQECLTY